VSMSKKSSVKENRRIALQKTPPYVCDCWALMVGDASQGAQATQRPMNVRCFLFIYLALLQVNSAGSLAKKHKRGLKVGRRQQFRLAKPAEKRKAKAINAMDLD
jgi:hypothetical protein